MMSSQIRSGKLTRNESFGLRTEATKRSPEAWAAGHTSALPWISVSAWLALAAGAAVILVGLLVRDSADGSNIVLVSGIACTALPVVAILLGVKKANTAANEQPNNHN